MINQTYQIKKCRLCNNADIKDIYSFGDLFVSNFTIDTDPSKYIKAPLVLTKCDNCDLIQLKHTAPQELLYSGFYWYRSSVTGTMISHLDNLVEDIHNEILLNDNDIVLDIGANDGTLLKAFSKKKLVRIGCEPATNLQKDLKVNCEFQINDFWNFDKLNNILLDNNFHKPKVITAIGMFYDLEDPNKFIGDISKSLNDDGIFVAQLMCLSSMLEKNDLGNICHEHLEFYSYKSLKFMYEKNGLEIYKITENNINGGSYRIYARKYNSGSIEYKENTSDLDLKKFIANVNSSKDKVCDFISNENKKGKVTHIYGASTKGNTILQYFDLSNQLIPFAAERSPEKYGKYTVGSWIPIISEDESRKMKPDYYLVLPWAFLDEFLEREADWRKGGGKFIVPFPDFKII
jgi:NDP-4-keto-2,6-dideoxyhexose 3-C-methyltransferase